MAALLEKEAQVNSATGRLVFVRRDKWSWVCLKSAITR
jgi:hypothetical protein